MSITRTETQIEIKTPTGIASSFLTEEKVRAVFVKNFCEFITPFFQRTEWMKQGNILRAIETKPSGPWYANVYAVALKTLGTTPIPVRDTKQPANALHTSFRERGLFYTAMGASAFWENIPSATSETGLTFNSLRLKRGVSPAEAFRSFSKQLTFIDCLMALDITDGLMLLEILGDEKFNRVINHFSPFIVGLNSGDGFRLSHLFLKKIPMLNPANLATIHPEWVIGQTYYLNNAPGYRTRHPHGEASGFNLVYLGEGRFTGFGLSPEGLTLLQIADLLLEEYNTPPLADDVVLPQKHWGQIGCYKVQLLISGTPRCFTGAEIKTIASKPGPYTSLFKTQLLPLVEQREAIQRKTLTQQEFAQIDLFVSQKDSFATIPDFELIQQLATAHSLEELDAICIALRAKLERS